MVLWTSSVGDCVVVDVTTDRLTGLDVKAPEYVRDCSKVPSVIELDRPVSKNCVDEASLVTRLALDTMVELKTGLSVKAVSVDGPIPVLDSLSRLLRELPEYTSVASELVEADSTRSVVVKLVSIVCFVSDFEEMEL